MKKELKKALQDRVLIARIKGAIEWLECGEANCDECGNAEKYEIYVTRIEGVNISVVLSV